MAERGPLPKPAQVHVLHGNPSKKPQAALLDGTVQPKAEIPRAPKILKGEAMKEWARIAPHLLRLGLVSEIDRAELFAYALNWGRLFDVEQKIAQLNKASADGCGGIVGDTPSGYKQMSVLLQISHRCQERIDKAAAHFGMSPAARSRVTASDPQLPLPGVDEKPQEGGWGGFN